MRVAVVGAGFTGCISALLASRRGAKVTLYDTQACLGGVLRDIVVGEQRYFNGCHYLEPGSLDLLNLTQGLAIFPHEYGALTALGNLSTRLLNDCAQPAMDGKVQIEPNAVLNGTALQRLGAYGPHAPHLIAWASGFGNLSDLDQSCLLHMQLSRIFFPDDVTLQDKKNSDPNLDRLIAVPRRKRNPRTQIETAMLPRDGYTPFLDEIKLALKSAGVQVEMNSPVKLTTGGPSVQLYVRGQEKVFDKVVWTSNPTGLLKRVFNISLKTPPIAMELWVGQFKCKQVETFPVPLPYYWQIFDDSTPVVRVYIYSLQGQLRFSVEAFDRNDHDQYQVLSTILQRLGLPTNFEFAAIIKQLRHINYSTTELADMQASTSALLERGIIPGGWCYFSREEKISSISGHLDKDLS